MKLLTHRQIQQKIKRLAIEILEHNYAEKEIILAGINNNGMGFAQLIYDELSTMTEMNIVLTWIRLNPANPISSEIKIGLPSEKLKDKVTVVIDDVANTGRTLFYAIKPILDTLPKKVEAAVLVDRMHKSFPIRIDYVGLSLATTLQEHIEVHILDVKEQSVYLN